MGDPEDGGTVTAAPPSFLQDIIKALCATLSAAFGCEVWPDESRQGIKMPCFFVRAISSSQRRVNKFRHQRRQSFAVQYVIDDDPMADSGGNLALLAMAEQLYPLLELLPVGGALCRGTNMHHTAEDAALSFFVNYDLQLREVWDIPLMDTVKVMEGDLYG